MSIRQFSLALSLLMAICGGCQGDDVERATVSGRVTLDGSPIPKGQIRFLPTNGPAWSAWINDGNYTTNGTKGVPVGDMQVRIEAYRIPSWYKGGNVTGEESDPPIEQYLPHKYNLQSDLKTTIEPGAEEVERDFALTSR